MYGDSGQHRTALMKICSHIQTLNSPSPPPLSLSSPSAQLTQERDLWQQASYDLAHKVAEEAGLRTVQRLQLCEKAWSKLAGHFAIILSNKDTQQACTPPPPHTHTHTHTQLTSLGNC